MAEAGPEEGAVHLPEEERQEGGEGGPAGRLRGRDVCLPPRRGTVTFHTLPSSVLAGVGADSAPCGC